MKKIYEFLLWNNCSNNCTFCHQRMHERKIDDKILIPEEQIRSLKLCQDFLDTKFENGNHILLVGGELFDIINEDVKEQFKCLIMRVVEKMSSNEIELLYLNTNLLYEDTSLLYWFLTILQNNQLLDRLKFTTSYDIIGRFTNQEREFLFYRNLLKIKNDYPDINIVINTILTKETCKRIQNDQFGAEYFIDYMLWHGVSFIKFTIKQWMDYFKVYINFIPFIKLPYDKAPDAPTKKEIFKTLQHIDSVIPGYLEQYTNNIGLKQKKLLYEYRKNIKDFVYCSSELGECDHSINFKRSFEDSDECFPCEIKKLLKYKAS